MKTSIAATDKLRPSNTSNPIVTTTNNKAAKIAANNASSPQLEYTAVSFRALKSLLLNKLPMGIVLIVTILLGMTLIVYLYFPSLGHSLPDTNGIPQNAPDSIPIDELESIANQLISSEQRWDSTRIYRYISLWNKMEKPVRQDMKESAWYKHFVFSLENKIKQIGNLESFDEKGVLTSNDAVFTLALTLDIARSNQFYNDRRSQMKQFKQLISKVQSELSQLDSSQQTIPNDDTADLSINNALREAFEVVPAYVREQKKENTKVPNTDSISHTSLAPKISITGENIRSLLDDYKGAYETGDINLMQSIFISNEDSIDSTLSRDTLDGYSTLFDNSVSRLVEFENLKWQYGQNVAMGTGNLSVNITLKNNITTQGMHASIVITLRIAEDNKLKISTIALSEISYTTSNPNERSIFELMLEPDIDLFIDDATPQKIPPTINTGTISIDTPTSAELNDLVDRYIHAYESGNIEQLSKILSEDIRTNENTTISDVKKEYAALFSKLSVRQIRISNLRWKFGKYYATGTAQLIVTVTTKNGKSENLVNGIIQFVAKRIDNKVRITQLYHIAQSK